MLIPESRGKFTRNRDKHAMVNVDVNEDFDDGVTITDQPRRSERTNKAVPPIDSPTWQTSIE